MRASWKKTLFEYVRFRNQLEIEGNPDRLSVLVRNESIIQKHANLAQRLVQRDQSRNVERIKNELYFKWLHVHEKTDRVIVRYQTRRHLHYRQGSHVFCEDRTEVNRCELASISGRWFITGFSSESDEHRDPTASSDAFNLFDHQEIKVPSIPYLHPLVEGQRRKPFAKYNRDAVKSYADRWWNDYNPEYSQFAVDCTNFVSQCLYAGGIPMDYTNSKEKGWWYRKKQGNVAVWSFSWSVAHSLYWYLMNPHSVFYAKQVTEPQLLQIGDVILYDWNGTGRYGHSVIVAEKDADGMPLVNAHTANSKHRYWDYQDSYAWSEQTRYRFFQIAAQ